jgi:creatinine amidohydrolase
MNAAPPRGGLMDEMTWPELARAAEAGLPAVVAVGATEQHGPHLPLATDTILPVGIALAAAEQYPLVVAPPLRFGMRSRALSGGGESFPGTLSLRASTLIATLAEVVGGLFRSGFDDVCVQGWHFENTGVLWEACDLAVEANDGLRVLLVEDPMPDFTDGELAELFPGGFGGWAVEHASTMETSLMYALRPDLVREDRIVDDAAARHPSWDVLPPPDDFVPPSGVLARPSTATREIGERFLRATSGRLVEALRTEFGEPVWAAPSAG